MAYRFNLEQSAAANARRIATDEIDRALALCGNESDRDEAAHELRKSCKKLRALIRLLRGPLEVDGKYRPDDEFFRDAARELGDVRDAEAMIECYDKLMRRYAGEVDRRHFAPLRRALTVRRRQVKADDDLAARLARFRDRMLDARERVEDWHVEDDGFGAVREGLRRTYRSGRRAMVTAFASPSGENFHAWRKHAKYHWYHTRLLEPVWKSELRPRRKASKELGDLLGDHHDLAVLRDHFAAQNGRARDLEALIERRTGELTGRAHIVGERLYAAKPKALAGEMEGWWRAAIEELDTGRTKEEADA
jgi:CHAD domain-containing protein